MNVLKRNGIDGPQPNLIVGNLWEFLNVRDAIVHKRYLKKYGKTCGYYFGHKMNVVTIDIELIKCFQIKDFDKFSDRQQFNLRNGAQPHRFASSHIISVKGSRWKEMRSILNPTFSAMKMKSMTPIIESAIDIFVNKIDNYSKKECEFDIYKDFQLLTSDVIAKTAFGLNTNIQHNSDAEYFKAAKAVFDLKPSFLFLFLVCFPSLDFFLYPLRKFVEIVKEKSNNTPQIIVSRIIEKAIEFRQKSKTKISDLLQLLLDANIDEESLKNQTTNALEIKMNDDLVRNPTENEPKETIVKKKMKTLNLTEIIANAIIFYEAGYETSSTALGFIAHFLINKPEIQEKIRDEIKQVLQQEGTLDYNTISKLSYMQCVINESLRYYPPVTTFITRNTKEDYPYKDIVIPKNATIRISVDDLHHCEEYWPNHNVFDPERFREKKNADSMAFQPFGNGPRNCIGMRFALFEIKLALAKLLLRYRLITGPSTENNLTVEQKSITQTPKYGVFCKAVPI